MDWQSGFNAAFGALMLLGGWVLRAVWAAIRDLTKNLRELEAKLPDTYARRDDVRAMFEDLKVALARIERKIDDKADKQ